MGGGKGSKIVLDRIRSKDLAPTRRAERIHFVSRAGESAALAGAPKTPDRIEGGIPPASGPFLVLGAPGVDKIHQDGLKAEFLDVGEACNGTGRVIIVLRGGTI